MTTSIYDPLEEELVSLPEASQEDYDVQPVNEFVPIEEPTERPIESIPKLEEVEEPKMKVAGASETTDGETENNENIESTEDKEEPIEDPLEKADELTHAAEIESESNEEAEDNQPNENETSEDDDEAEIDEINEVENSLELSIIEPDEPVTQDQVESVEKVILYTPEMEIYIIPETIKVEPSETQLIPEEEAIQAEELLQINVEETDSQVENIESDENVNEESSESVTEV